MEEVKKKEMSFFTRVYKAITNFDIYSKFAEESLSKAIIYAMILTMIIALIISLNYANILSGKLQQGTNYLNENIQNINLTNGIFSFNNNQYTNYENEENIIPIIIVDTSENPDIEEYKKKVNLYDIGLIILKDKILLPTAEKGIFNSLVYSDYNIEDMNRDEILTAINSKTIYAYMIILIFIAEFINEFINILFNAVMLAIMGQLIALFLRLRLKFVAALKMGIYSLTLPTILLLLYVLINSRTGFVIENFLWLYTTISYIYIVIAMLMIKTDFINMQQELIKIQIEQQKVHEEIIEREKEKDDKEKDEEKKQEDNKEDKNNEEGLNEQTQE